MAGARSLDILPTAGRQIVTWDPADPASVEAARAEFARLRAEGWALFAPVTRSGGTVETRTDAFAEGAGAFVARSPIPRQTDEFPPEAGQVVAVRPMRGG